MRFPDEIFRAYDIRGLTPQALSPGLVEHIGQALGSEAQQQGVGELVVGRDGRLSGPGLVEALCAGLRASGCDVVDIGQVPTPVLYFAAQQYGGSGVQVTGSHNPPDYNGLKMMLKGAPLSAEAIQGLKRRMLENDYTHGRGNWQQQAVLEQYRQRMLQGIELARPLKVVLDCGNGVAGVIAPQLFRDLGCEVVELFCEVDGRFPNHHPDPSQLANLQDLIRVVQQNQAEVGLAFDGDGDRLGVVAGDGSVIWPDRVMQLFAQSLLSTVPGAEIIFDVKCSRDLPRAIRAAGGKPTMWKTGHSFIKSKLKQSGAALAGELSGHIFFREWGGFDDGLYAGARLCELLAADARPPLAVFAALPNTLNTPELRVDMAEGEPHRLVEKLVSAAAFDAAEVTCIDGLRVDFADGFGLVRASNTTPSVILRFEAEDAPGLARIQQQFRELFTRVAPTLNLPF